VQAYLATDRHTRECLLEMAAEYDEAALNRSFVNALFYDEPVGRFRDGYLFRSPPDLAAIQQDPQNGSWDCDIAHENKLTWSDRVYKLFGLRTGDRVDRDWAVARYVDHSKAALDRVRKEALRRNFGFILDAEIEPEGAGSRWIRVLAVPELKDGRVVRLHGVKRSI
jgi:hypothetical protein